MATMRLVSMACTATLPVIPSVVDTRARVAEVSLKMRLIDTEPATASASLPVATEPPAETV